MAQDMQAGNDREVARPDSHLAFAISLMEHLVVPTFVLDAEQKVVIWNRACERLTGIPSSEVVGTRNHWKAFYEESRPCLADLVAMSALEQMATLYAAADKPGEPSYGVHAENWCWMPRRGQHLYLAIDAGPVFDASGRLIAVIETLRDITEKHVAQIKVEEQASQLKAHFEERQRETELARRILEHQVRSDLMAQAGVQYAVIPANNFSGDMVLAARSPAGRLYAILGDATGHGLSAAVSVLPMVQEFYRLVDLSTPLAVMIESINFLLANSLPLGRFVAAAFVVLDEPAKQGEIWVGGVPNALMFDAEGKLARRFESSNLPLGISKASEIAGSIESFTWDRPSRLMLVSDGIVEACNTDGAAFGEARLIATLEGALSGETMVTALGQAMQRYLQGTVAHDDMSMLGIDCS